MHEELRDLMAVILQGVIVDERFSRELAALARELENGDRAGEADLFLDRSRHHRVMAIQGRARLAAMTERYVRSFNDHAVLGGYDC